METHTEKTKTNINTKKNIAKSHKHEAHIDEDNIPLDENDITKPSKERETSKNQQKDPNISIKNELEDIETDSENESELFPSKSSTNDDEKSIRVLDSDIEQKPIHSQKSEDKTRTSSLQKNIAKVCRNYARIFLS